MTIPEWLYVIDEKSTSWNYTRNGVTVSARDVALGAVTDLDNPELVIDGVHIWPHPKRAGRYSPGDRLWVVTSDSPDVVIGMGIIQAVIKEDPNQPSAGSFIAIRFDDVVTRKLGRSVPGLDLAIFSGSPRTLPLRAVDAICKTFDLSYEEVPRRRIIRLERPEKPSNEHGKDTSGECEDALSSGAENSPSCVITGETGETYAIYHGVRLAFPSHTVSELVVLPKPSALAVQRRKALPHVSDPSILKPGRIFAFMPGASDDRCPWCRKRYSLRRCCYGFPSNPFPADPSTILQGCCIDAPFAELPSYRCIACKTEFDDEGERLQPRTTGEWGDCEPVRR